MTDETERGAIRPEDWPLEETTVDENRPGLRNDVGASLQQPRAKGFEPGGAGLNGDRGETGTLTPGERGTDVDPR
jgi:hypothetical protein